MNFTDVHNHTLPGIDDGAKHNDMALSMLQAAHDAGTRRIILTPHHLNGAFTNDSSRIIKQVKELQALATEHKLNLQLYCGSEVHLVPETINELLTKKTLTYCNNNKAALIELPKHSIPTGADKILSELLHNKITPVIAHPERNSILRKNSSVLKEWVMMGCCAQLTAQSCTGDFGHAIQDISLNMLSDGLIHLIGSDAHRPTGRSPDLKSAYVYLSKLFDSRSMEQLFFENPSRLINAEELLTITPMLKNNTSLPVNNNAKVSKNHKKSFKRNNRNLSKKTKNNNKYSLVRTISRYFETK